MKAVICSEYGPVQNLRIQEFPAPELKAGCVRLKITIASINPPDILMSQGRYQVKPSLPFVLGVEGAGIVLEVADDVSQFRPGDRAMTYAGQGCFAEQAVVAAQRVCLIPDGMSEEAASGFVLAYGTVYHALIDCGELASGQTIVVLGAAGGLGLGAVQVAKAVGARVIAVASTSEKRAKCVASGADEAIESEPSLLRDRIRALTGGRGADVVLDVVGGELTEPTLRAIAPYGRFVVAGYASGQIPAIKANLILLKQAKVVGASYRLFAENQPANAASNLQALCDMWKRGLLHPQVTSRHAFANVVDALSQVANRQIIGKAALLIS